MIGGRAKTKRLELLTGPSGKTREAAEEEAELEVGVKTQ